jgi:hypothetical protein
MQRRSLREAALDDGAAIRLGPLNDAPCSQQLKNLVNIAGRHGADQRDMAGEVLDHVQRLLIVLSAVLVEVLLDELEPLSDARGHRRLDSLPGPFKLVNDERGYQ